MGNVVKSELKIVLYNAAGHDREIDQGQIDLKKLSPDQLLWISGDMAQVQAVPQLPSEVREALCAETGSSRLEIFENCYRFHVPLANCGSKKDGEVMFVVGQACLVTVSPFRPGFMDHFVETDRGETLNGKLTSSALAAALFSELLEAYRVEIVDIDREIDKLDEAILGARETRTPLKKLAGLRRRVSKLRAELGDTAGTVHGLVRPDFLAHIDKPDTYHFEAIAHTLGRLDDSIARVRETIIGSFDLYTTRVAQDTNQLVKALTVATVITGVVGCAAGVFGMNFDTPFFHSGIEGFFVVTASMVVVSLAIFTVAIWRRWF
jgi:magnesium transporter